MSICQYVNMSICQYVNMSICQYVNMSTQDKLVKLTTKDNIHGDMTYHAGLKVDINPFDSTKRT
jgi:hypothetical protein